MSSIGILASGVFVVALADGCRASAEPTRTPTSVGPAPSASARVEDPVALPPADPDPDPTLVAAPAPKTAATLASLGPFYDARVVEGWLAVSVDAESEEYERFAAKTQDPLWAGNPALPKVLREFPAIHFVWSRGVARRDKYARAGISPAGWKIEYRPQGIKNPVLAMGQAPADGATVRAGAKVTKIKKSHAMAVRLQEILAAEPEDGFRPRGRLKSFELQTTPGRFGAADRVIAVSGWSPPPPDDDIGDEYGVVFTADAAGNVVQRVTIASGLVKVVGLVDVDGDGVDEILTEMSGYEIGSGDLHRLGPSSVESITLWDHSE